MNYWRCLGLGHETMVCTVCLYILINPGPLFINWTDVLPQDLVKSRSREIYTFLTALKFGKHLGSSAVEMAVKFHCDTIIIRPNHADSSLYEIWR